MPANSAGYAVRTTATRYKCRQELQAGLPTSGA